MTRVVTVVGWITIGWFAVLAVALLGLGVTAAIRQRRPAPPHHPHGRTAAVEPATSEVPHESRAPVPHPELVCHLGAPARMSVDEFWRRTRAAGDLVTLTTLDVTTKWDTGDDCSPFGIPRPQPKDTDRP